jgi:raffinose/stachyose/melibiose transport system permease protein
MTTTDTVATTLTEGPSEITLDTTAVRTAQRLRRRNADRTTRIKSSRIGFIVKWIILGVGSVVMLVPLYILIISAFKSQQDILLNPLGFSDGSFTFDYMIAAINSQKFNVVAAYGVTLLFVILVNFCSIVLSAPAAYVIARGRSRWHFALLILFVSGVFIPSQVTLIPVVFILKMLGLIGTIPGLVLFQTAGTLPVTIFLYAAYIRSIPRDIDEAASLDGAGKIRAFWSCIFPIMRPVVATMLVITSIGVWNDFVSPQIVLGFSSGIYTVTTGVYAALGQYASDYTTVFPTLLLAVAPAILFFMFMQRFIIGGIAAGATKG